jgi:hypothetical protein
MGESGCRWTDEQSKRKCSGTLEASGRTRRRRNTRLALAASTADSKKCCWNDGVTLEAVGNEVKA